jgi:hypothetical protein
MRTRIGADQAGECVIAKREAVVFVHVPGEAQRVPWRCHGRVLHVGLLSSGASAASCLRRSLADVVEIDPSHRDFRRILMFRFCIWRGFGGRCPMVLQRLQALPEFRGLQRGASVSA